MRIDELTEITETSRVVYRPRRRRSYTKYRLVEGSYEVVKEPPELLHIVDREGRDMSNLTPRGQGSLYMITRCNRALHWPRMLRPTESVDPDSLNEQNRKLCPRCGDQADFEAALERHRADNEAHERLRDDWQAQCKAIRAKRVEITAHQIKTLFNDLAETYGLRVDPEAHTLSYGPATYQITLVDVAGLPELPKEPWRD